jgi:hypothetical protein
MPVGFVTEVSTPNGARIRKDNHLSSRSSLTVSLA